MGAFFGYGCVYCFVMGYVFVVASMCAQRVGDVSGRGQFHGCWVVECILCIVDCELGISRCLGSEEVRLGLFMFGELCLSSGCSGGLVVGVWWPGGLHR